MNKKNIDKNKQVFITSDGVPVQLSKEEIEKVKKYLECEKKEKEKDVKK